MSYQGPFNIQSTQIPVSTDDATGSGLISGETVELEMWAQPPWTDILVAGNLTVNQPTETIPVLASTITEINRMP